MYSVCTSLTSYKGQLTATEPPVETLCNNKTTKQSSAKIYTTHGDSMVFIVVLPQVHPAGKGYTLRAKGVD
jgi:hypothetical protein